MGNEATTPHEGAHPVEGDTQLTRREYAGVDWRLIAQGPEDLTFDERLRCRAKSSQTGERCKRAATPGTWVCASHGSRSPNTLRKARLRLLDLVDPATAKLARILAKTDDEKVALKAIEMIFDRTGLSPRVSLDVTDARQMLIERLTKMHAERESKQQENDDIIDAELIGDTNTEETP